MSTYEETLVSISLDADASIAVHTSPPYPAGANPSGVQYRFVKVTGDHAAGLAAGVVGEIVVGVLQSKPQVVGQAATVAIDGIAMVEAGAAIAAGAAVGPDADGRAVTGGGHGIALYSAVAPNAGETGELIPVLLRLNATAQPV